jgi:hypothetical protein
MKNPANSVRFFIPQLILFVVLFSLVLAVLSPLSRSAWQNATTFGSSQSGDKISELLDRSRTDFPQPLLYHPPETENSPGRPWSRL